MEISKDLETLLLSINLKTDMNVVITDDKKVIYYTGKSEECGKYLFVDISNELKNVLKDEEDIKFYKENEVIELIANNDEKYYSQCVCKIMKDGKINKCFIFYKSDSDFDDDDIFIINSAKYLIEKYFN